MFVLLFAIFLGVYQAAKVCPSGESSMCCLFGVGCMTWRTVVQGAEPPECNITQVFQAQFDSYDQIGAAMAVTVGDDPLVQLYGGYTNRSALEDYDLETLQVVFSTSKVWSQ
jgi:hypothetical protein